MADIEIPQPGASQVVGRMLSEALADHPDFQWLGLVSEDGFAIASEGDIGIDDDSVAASAVRMMIQVRATAKALGQSGASQMFMEGGDSGICIIDKDPWVLVLVGAPGVPIGLLRYEAREIADSFPLATQAALPSSPESSVEESPQLAEPGFSWVDESTEVVEPEIRLADEPLVPEVDDVMQPDGEPEIRWADEPLAPEVDEQPAGAVEFEPVMPSPTSQWLEDVAEPEPPAGFTEFTDISDEPAPEPALLDLSDLAPPTGASYDLPPPAGPAYDLPPPG